VRKVVVTKLTDPNPSRTKPAYKATTAATAARTPIAPLKPFEAAPPVNGGGVVVAVAEPVPVATPEDPVPTGTDALVDVTVVVADAEPDAEPDAELVALPLADALVLGLELAELELELPPVPAKALIPASMAVVIPLASWAAMD